MSSSRVKNLLNIYLSITLQPIILFYTSQISSPRLLPDAADQAFLPQKLGTYAWLGNSHTCLHIMSHLYLSLIQSFCIGVFFISYHLHLQYLGIIGFHCHNSVKTLLILTPGQCRSDLRWLRMNPKLEGKQIEIFRASDCMLFLLTNCLLLPAKFSRHS